MRVDEVAAPAVDESEPHGAMNGTAVPGHPQVLVGDGEPVDLVVAHAVVLRQNDVDGIVPPLELAAEAKDHFAEAAGLGDRGTLGGHHHDIHGATSLEGPRRARNAGASRCPVSTAPVPGPVRRHTWNVAIPMGTLHDPLLFPGNGTEF